jgi:hypothetical protein
VNPLKQPIDTIGFGVPAAEFDPHHFAVIVPAGRGEPVTIVERFGIKAGIGNTPEEEVRCVLARCAWAAIADAAKQTFNERLKANGLKTARWQVGEVKVARLLGKELMVLAWAVEKAEPGNYANAVRNWIGLRPEERWWLFSMAATASGRAEDGDIGWRKAIRFGLAEAPSQIEMRLDGGEALKPRLSPGRRAKEPETLPLLEGIA